MRTSINCCFLCISREYSYQLNRFTFIVKKPDGAATINFWAYINVFSTSVWLSTLCAIILGTFVHFFARHQEFSGIEEIFLKDFGAVSVSILTKGLCCHKEKQSHPSNSSCQLLNWFLNILLLLWCFDISHDSCTKSNQH